MKILVISSNLIGDTILSTGVIKYFRNKNPEAKFTFVIGPSAKSIFKNFKSVETIITVSKKKYNMHWLDTVSYTHLRAHETSLHLVCRLLLEKKK